METTTLNVPSITCSICSGKIQKELKSMDGIKDVNINLKSQSVEVSYNPDETKPLDIKKKIMTMGYDVT